MVCELFNDPKTTFTRGVEGKGREHESPFSYDNLSKSVVLVGMSNISVRKPGCVAGNCTHF